MLNNEAPTSLIQELPAKARQRSSRGRQVYAPMSSARYVRGFDQYKPPRLIRSPNSKPTKRVGDEIWLRSAPLQAPLGAA
jgi:hypothetical protein